VTLSKHINVVTPCQPKELIIVIEKCSPTTIPMAFVKQANEYLTQSATPIGLFSTNLTFVLISLLSN
jgi:hypothetical protein